MVYSLTQERVVITTFRIFVGSGMREQLEETAEWSCVNASRSLALSLQAFLVS